jgi:NAD(P)-dependent dehydrogenase (short-subunit alcohol dehydrogenase family)
MSIVGWFKKVGPNGFGYNTTAEEVTEGVDLAGKTFLLTGCNSGLGSCTLEVLAKRGARVIGAARSLDTAKQACAAIAGDAVPLACELSEPGSVRAAVDAVKTMGHRLDGIVANAGIMALPERTVKHGYELQFFTNHIGHYLLVMGLLDRLADDGRVVIVSSDAHRGAYAEGIRLDDLAAERGYSPWGAYGQSKLANLLFARELSRRLPAGQTANSLHPGVIATNLSRHMGAFTQAVFRSMGPLVATKSISQGSATQCYLAAHPDAKAHRGDYLADCNPKRPSRHGDDDELAARLWDRTEEIVAGLPG